MAPVHYHYGKFPPSTAIDWSKLIPLLGPASAAVARYDGMLAAVPNPRVLLAPLSTQEAVLSSRIEGTQATMGEVLEFEAGQEPDSPTRREDINEVLQYRAAMRQAEEMLKTLPLSQRVIRRAHSTLLAGVRGEGKSPGEYRRLPNWIGPDGCSIDDATFVPIGANYLQNAMSVWEKYIHEDTPDRLVQLAVLHAEFEALHPFLDGNGRLGRLMVPLFLWQHNIISAPMFYISAYFEVRRETYYNGLLAVSRDDDWTGWCCFFLEAIREQAEENLKKTREILNLYESMKYEILKMTRSQHAIRALDWIFEKPVFKSSHFFSTAGIPKPSARRLLSTLHNGGILRVIRPSSGRRPAVFIYPALLNIAEGKEVF